MTAQATKVSQAHTHTVSRIGAATPHIEAVATALTWRPQKPPSTLPFKTN